MPCPAYWTRSRITKQQNEIDRDSFQNRTPMRQTIQHRSRKSGVVVHPNVSSIEWVDAHLDISSPSVFFL